MQATTEVLSHPDKQTPMRQLAGMREAETLKNMQIGAVVKAQLAE